jgi:hypothetical protein
MKEEFPGAKEFAKTIAEGKAYEVFSIAGPIDTNSFKPNKNILTRYGRKLLKEGQKYYGTITQELDTIADIRRMIDECKITKKYRSIDDPWETTVNS